MNDESVAAYLNRHIQVVQYLFQHDTFQIIIFVTESRTDALQDELCGTVECDRQAVALHQRTRNDTGKRIAGTGIMCGQIRAGHFPVAVAKAIVGIDGRRSWVSADRYAGSDDNAGTLIGKCFQCFLQFCVGDTFLERSQFGKVGGDDIGQPDEFFHFSHHFLCNTFIQVSVVA